MAENIEMKIIRDSLRGVYDKDMQQNLWSKLPTELVANIIAQTTHPSAQEAWCLATEKISRYLYGIAMKTRWYSVTVDDRDLIPAPGHDNIRFNRVQLILEKQNISHDWPPAGKMLKMLLVKDELGRCPANYVRHVIFDFRMLRYWTDEVEDLEDRSWEIMPSLESAEYTLDQLEEHLYNLRSVTCYGDTPPKILDFTSRYATGAREVKLRELGSYGLLYINLRDAPDRATDTSFTLPLELGLLSNLQQLERLSIHRFSYAEVEGLRSILPKIIKLQSLELACRPMEHHMPNGCAFRFLFSTTPEKQNEPMLWLPSGLKRLSMIDPHYQITEDMQSIRSVCSKSYMEDGSLVQPQYLVFPDGLEHLTIDLVHVNLITFILNCVNMASLKCLAVPEYYTRCHKTQSQSRLDDVIQRSGNQLETIRILQAWETPNNQLANLQFSQEVYTVEDLVLGTRNENQYTEPRRKWHEIVPIPTLSNYVYGFSQFYFRSMIGKWGETLKRIRIDHIDIVPDLDVSELSQRYCQVVKILMLQPALRNLSSTEQHDTKLVGREICDELAQRIVLYGPQSLCVIVISTQWYWISRDTGANTTRYSLWTWEAAKRDALQSILMASTLDTSDMDFLENRDVPYWHERDTMEWHRNLASSEDEDLYAPTYEMMNQWNHLTMYRVRET